MNEDWGHSRRNDNPALRGLFDADVLFALYDILKNETNLTVLSFKLYK